MNEIAGVRVGAGVVTPSARVAPRARYALISPAPANHERASTHYARELVHLALAPPEQMYEKQQHKVK